MQPATAPPAPMKHLSVALVFAAAAEHALSDADEHASSIQYDYGFIPRTRTSAPASLTGLLSHTGWSLFARATAILRGSGPAQALFRTGSADQLAPKATESPPGQSGAQAHTLPAGSATDTLERQDALGNAHAPLKGSATATATAAAAEGHGDPESPLDSPRADEAAAESCVSLSGADTDPESVEAPDTDSIPTIESDGTPTMESDGTSMLESDGTLTLKSGDSGSLAPQDDLPFYSRLGLPLGSINASLRRRFLHKYARFKDTSLVRYALLLLVALAGMVCAFSIMSCIFPSHPSATTDPESLEAFGCALIDDPSSQATEQCAEEAAVDTAAW